MSIRFSSSSFPLPAAVLGLALSACAVPSSQEPPREQPEETATPEDDTPSPAASPEEEGETPSTTGGGNSAIIGFETDGESICGGDLAEETFRHGLCVCGDLGMAGSLRTASVHAGEPDLVAGGVGVNGDYSLAGSADIGGSLVVGGRFSPTGVQNIGSELRVGGNVNAAGSIEVGGDAYLAGRVSAIGLDIEGTLFTQEEQSMFLIDAAGNTVMAFDIPPPCGCDGADEVVTFVSDAETDNNNAALGISPDVVAGVTGDVTLEVGPGRVYLDSVDVAGVLTFVVNGPTAVFIAGDLAAAGLVDVEFATNDAEFNLFIDGSIHTAGQLELGTDEDVSKVRVYMSGNGDISLAGGLAIRGGLSAPQSDIRTAGDVILEGSILVGEIHSAGTVDVRYDTGFISPPADCEDETEPEPAPEAQPEPAPEAQPEPQPTPEAQPEPAPEADDDGPCETSVDCPSPQICFDGVCDYLPL